MRALLVAAILGLLVAVGPTSALGQEEGVTLDPGDPAAKEYALPHEEARREAGGEAKAPVTPGSRDSATFGEGIGTSSDQAALSADNPADATPAKKKPAPKQATEPADDAPSTPASTPTTPQPVQAGIDGDDSGPSATTALLGGGIAVVLVALLGGFGLRAVRGPHD